MDGADTTRRKGEWGSDGRRLVIGFLVAAIAIVPAVSGAAGAVDPTRGRVQVTVVGVARASGPVCLTLRDLTENMVVGSYCDGDVTDQNPSPGRIALDLPRRSFAVDASARGGTVESVTPGQFVLGVRQSVVVRLARTESSRRS
jgi:hypothetical protein